MPRPGGESDKLGNRYESWWTVHNLTDVLAGDAVALQPEAYEEPIGVEFVKTLRDGSTEFHSVKRQRAGAGWTLRELTAADDRGRSVLKDLFDKLDGGSQRIVVFVSTTIHSQAYEIWDRSQRCNTPDDFRHQLKKDDRDLDPGFTNYVLPLCNNDLAVALKRFHSLRLIPQGEYELRRQVETNVRRLLYRPDGRDVDTLEVVLKLADFIYESLGRRLIDSDVRMELARHGYNLKDWARDAHVSGQVRALNERYLRQIELDHILNRRIPRIEATTVAKALLQKDGKLAQLVGGTAGLGKSCVLAQIIREIEKAGVPYLAIRLDNIPLVNSTRALGRTLELPDSPAIVLAGLSQGHQAVLVVDQLDAMSVVSGRNPDLWQVFEDIMQEVRMHPNMRLLLACRVFDLENDPRLAGLVNKDGATQRADLVLLPAEIVKDVVREGGGIPDRLSARELEILRLPLHLYLFLHGQPTNPTSFGGRQELFARFWDTKRQMAKRRNVNFERVVGLLADQLSQSESISTPVSRLDLVAEDANALVSDNVLVLENRRYRFFHESFFDYAFARRFVRESRNLVHFLTIKCAEQHLFRRAQVRQVLAYQREDSRETYLVTLSALLNHPAVRIHLKKLALDWLAQLNDPTEEEWQIAQPLLKHPKLNWAAFNVLWGRLPWFDMLNRIGVLPRLLSDPDANFVNRCVQALSLQEVLKNRSSQVAALLRLFKRTGAIWDQRFKDVFRFGQFHYSQEMFDLVLELVEDGLFDEGDELRWHSLTEMAEKRPDLAVTLLARVLNRLCAIAKTQNESNPFNQSDRGRQIEPHFISTVAKNAPVQFATQIAPIIQNLVLANARPAKSGGYSDTIWEHISFGAEYHTHDALLAADPLAAGINSARGSAADSFSKFLFSHPELTDELVPFMETLAKDRAVAVRAVNVQGLMALLNTRKEKAVTLFLDTCQAAEELWATRPVEDFFYYATYTHYKALRPLLLQMLVCKNKDARHAAARQITLAAFRHAEADEDMKLALKGDEECRRGIAEIYAHNVFNETVREKCVPNLEQLFNDPAKSVRHTAASWFFDRKGPWADWQRSLLAQYIESEALADGDIQCQMNLKDTPEKLPEEVLRLGERAIGLFEQEIKNPWPAASRFSYYVPGLILRLYEQSKVEATRRKCLDLLDQMIALGWSEAPAELAKLDRW